MKPTEEQIKKLIQDSRLYEPPPKDGIVETVEQARWLGREKAKESARKLKLGNLQGDR